MNQTNLYHFIRNAIIALCIISGMALCIVYLTLK